MDTLVSFDCRNLLCRSPLNLILDAMWINFPSHVDGYKLQPLVRPIFHFFAL